MQSAASDPAGSVIASAPLARFRAALDQLCIGADSRLGIAVSGGPDSLALLLLAQAALPSRVEAATVDHGLRPDSADEAIMVAGVCTSLGVAHETLKGPWHADATVGLQAAARAYRYGALGDWCGRRGLPLLATAHHADDQAETLLMRLARGVGVGGLSAIRQSRPLRETGAAGARSIRLVRPVLQFTKAELGAIVTTAGLIAVDDPSNASDLYDRTRARRLLNETDWLDPARLAATARHMADAEAALAWATDAAFGRHAVHQENACTLDPAGLPDEILYRLVDRLVTRLTHSVTGGQARFRGSDLARLIDRLRRGETATLGRVLARPGPHWRFTIAPPRRIPPVRP